MSNDLNQKVVSLENHKESSEVHNDPSQNFTPGQQSNGTNNILQQLGGMMNTSSGNVATDANMENIKNDISQKLVQAITEGKNADQIIEELFGDNSMISNNPEIKGKIKESLESAITDIRNQNPLLTNPEKMQQHLFTMMTEVLQGNKSVETVVEDLVSTFPDHEQIDKNKIRSDLTKMLNEALQSFANQAQNKTENTVDEKQDAKEIEEPDKNENDYDYENEIVEIDFHDELPKDIQEWMSNGKFMNESKIKCYYNNHSNNYKIILHTDNYSYHITLILPSETYNGYLGAISKSMNRNPLENHYRGNDLCDGEYNIETFNQILLDIVSLELKKFQ